MVIQRDTIEEIGGLSEKYFMYIEDMDFCYKAWLHNYKVFYYPNLLVQYEGDRKSSKVFKFKNLKYTLHHIRNYYLFFMYSKKNKLIKKD